MEDMHTSGKEKMQAKRPTKAAGKETDRQPRAKD